MLIIASKLFKIFFRDAYLLLKRNALVEEAIPAAFPPLSVFGEAFFGDDARGSKAAFKKFQLSVNNARITRSKDPGGEIEAFNIEAIVWYFGCEAKRQPPSNLNLTFIPKVGDDLVAKVERTKESCTRS